MGSGCRKGKAGTQTRLQFFNHLGVGLPQQQGHNNKENYTKKWNKTDSPH